MGYFTAVVGTIKNSLLEEYHDPYLKGDGNYVGLPLNPVRISLKFTHGYGSIHYLRSRREVHSRGLTLSAERKLALDPYRRV